MSPPETGRVRWIRWKAAVPLALVLTLVVLVWLLFLDTAVERGIEGVGTRLVGARVELEAADVRLSEGVIRLQGLQVTDPAAPMTNLVEADELSLNVRVAPLLERKLVVDTLAALGVRFGTQRATSGAIDLPPSSENGLLTRQVDQWTESVRVPPLSLGTVTSTVDVSALEPDSLATLQRARALGGAADSMRTAWEQRLVSLDPRPLVDSATALLGRIEGRSLRSLGLGGVRDALTTGRRTVSTLGELGSRLDALQADVSGGVDSLRSTLASVEGLRDQDYAYALGLLNVPSLSAPDLGPSLFGEWAKERARPVLYWMGLAERYMPPGLRRQLDPGPRRARAPGTNVSFPREEDLPRLLVRSATASVELTGRATTAGQYTASLADLTSEPARLGRPMRLSAERVGGVTGPASASLSLVLDHTGETARDSVLATAGGVPLPAFGLAPLGGSVSLGRGTAAFSLARSGEELALGWRLSSGSVEWTLSEGRTQSQVERVLWGAVSRLDSLSLDARVSGSLPSLSVSVRSNLADAVARGLREQLGAEVDAARARVRAEVDRRVAGPLGEARATVGSVENDLRQRVDGLRAEVEGLRTRLEAEVLRLTGIGAQPSVR